MPAPLSRSTPAPLLAPGETVVLFGGVCKLCNGWAKFLIRHDPGKRVRLATVQSAEGQQLLVWAGLPMGAFDTLAVIRGNHYWVRSAGFFEVVAQLPAPWPALGLGLGLLRVCPRPLRDWVYVRIALNRYRLFGKHDACPLLIPEYERRFLRGAP